MDANLRIIDEAVMSAVEDAAIRAALCRCFPDDRQIFSETRSWHGVFPAWSVVAELDKQIIAHAGVVERDIRFGSVPMRVAGIQNMFVLPEHRKTGLSSRVMSVAIDEALRRNLDLGLLFCIPRLTETYAAVGWRLLDARKVVRIDEEGRLQPLPCKNVAMYFPLRCSDVPLGEIHLQGNDW